MRDRHLRKFRPRLHTLERRDTPASSQLFALAEDSGTSLVAVYIAPTPTTPAPAEPDPGEDGLFFNPIDVKGNLVSVFQPYPNFKGGVRVALGDVSGDGIDDLITAPGPGGGPHIKVYDGAFLRVTGEPRLLTEFFAYDANFAGGVYVAAGQVDPRSETAEIVTGAGQFGGPHVKVFGAPIQIITAAAPSLTAANRASVSPALIQYSEFFAYDASFQGGVRVAVGNVQGDIHAEVITAPGAGGGPHVRVFDVPPPDPLALLPYTHKVVDEFFAYDANFAGGVSIAAGNWTARDDGFDDLVTAPSKGGGAHVRLFHQKDNVQQVFHEFFVDNTSTVGLTVGFGGQVSHRNRNMLFVGYGAGLAFTQELTSADQRLLGYGWDGTHFYGVRPQLQPAFLNESNVGLVVGV